MTQQEIEKIRGIAHGFRDAMDSCAPNLEYEGFRHYPYGFCGDASNFMGKYFRSIGIDGWRYTAGYRGSMEEGTYQSHAWLEKEGLIVDLTPDQFSDAPAKVIVSTDSPWHKTFEENGHSRPDQDVYAPGDIQRQLDEAYKTIVKTFHSAHN